MLFDEFSPVSEVTFDGLVSPLNVEPSNGFSPRSAVPFDGLRLECVVLLGAHGAGVSPYSTWQLGGSQRRYLKIFWMRIELPAVEKFSLTRVGSHL